MNSNPTYLTRRRELEVYFDRTAADAWARLTSSAPVSRIRATVRAGRDAMRETLLGYLGSSLANRTLLDAGCGTGALATSAAARGAVVTAIDISPTLIALATARYVRPDGGGSVQFRIGDMQDAALGQFDHVVAMDSLIHYSMADVIATLAAFAPRVRHSMLLTFAPRTPLLMAMWATGRLFPRGDRAPAIEPLSEPALRKAIAAEPQLRGWLVQRTRRIDSAFYKSQALELSRA